MSDLIGRVLYWLGLRHSRIPIARPDQPLRYFYRCRFCDGQWEASWLHLGKYSDVIWQRVA